MFMPKQKLHTHEEVFKDHVSGQYDETIFRFRVPGGWIYTHTIIRFGSVDKNYVADTFVPDPKCMVRPCVASGFAELAVSGLASMYPAFDWSICSGPSWISARVRSD